MLAVEIKAEEIEMPDLIIPAPLHIKRLRERGFNQASLLAKHLGKILKIPVDHHSLVKRKATANQAELTLKTRRTNLNGAFQVTRPLTANHVAILDDVVTTGSTAREIAKTLKRNGVDYIQVWGVAHTL
jgi:ComF family protein